MGVKMDKEVARELYQEHYLPLLKLACYLTKSMSASEDLVAETFMSVFDHYHQYDQSRPFKPWVTKILVNRIRKYHRQKQWLSLFQSEEVAFVEEQDPQQMCLKIDRDEALWQAVEGLTPKSREVIVLHYYESFSLEEVAEILSIPLGTCKSRLNTGLNGLRKQKTDLCSYL